MLQRFDLNEVQKLVESRGRYHATLQATYKRMTNGVTGRRVQLPENLNGISGLRVQSTRSECWMLLVFSSGKPFCKRTALENHVESEGLTSIMKGAPEPLRTSSKQARQRRRTMRAGRPKGCEMASGNSHERAG